MSIFAKQEICVHFKEIHCLSSYPCGPSALRIFMFYKAKNKHYYAIPVSHLQKTPTKSNDHIQIGENFYRTKEFLMRPDRTVLFPSCRLNWKKYAFLKMRSIS